MSTKSTQPLKGFRDRYPEDKALQEYIFSVARATARSYGFQEYDGPLVEPMELYVGKSSQELLEEQAFTLQDKNGEALMLRPEMTPTLARMVAARSQELNLPIRFFNIGLRYRYEAPQRGRDREFYQMDFDILGADSPIADIEILRLLVDFFTRLGADHTHFALCINSREVLNSQLITIGIPESLLPSVISCIDKRSKMDTSAWNASLEKAGLSSKQVQDLIALLDDTSSYAEAFSEIRALARSYGIEKYIQVRPDIVRGLDYYTGLVFEVVSLQGDLRRSILGGGRYANLVEKFGSQSVSGIGCATSDTIIREFLTDNNLVPDQLLKPADVLVTIFSQDTVETSLQAAQACREAGLATELYPSIETLQKQLKHANKSAVPFVLVIGPDEIHQGQVMLKNMQTGEQQTLTLELAIAHIANTSHAR